MATVPRRGRFQIHLSTAVVLMFVAGGIIWANVRLSIYGIYGWPWAAIWSDVPIWKRKPAITVATGVPFPSDMTFKNVYDARAISVDVAVALAILFAVWFLCEWLIRRRAARKGD